MKNVESASGAIWGGFILLIILGASFAVSPYMGFAALAVVVLFTLFRPTK